MITSGWAQDSWELPFISPPMNQKEITCLINLIPNLSYKNFSWNAWLFRVWNLHSNVGDMYSIPVPRRFYIPQGYCKSICITTEPTRDNYWIHEPQEQKAHVQKWEPSAAKNKNNKNKTFPKSIRKCGFLEHKLPVLPFWPCNEHFCAAHPNILVFLALLCLRHRNLSFVLHNFQVDNVRNQIEF